MISLLMTFFFACGDKETEDTAAPAEEVQDTAVEPEDTASEPEDSGEESEEEESTEE